MTLGEKLQSLRRERGIKSQHELARRSGLKVQAINNYELGQRTRISGDVIVKLARGYGMESTDLFVTLKPYLADPNQLESAA